MALALFVATLAAYSAVGSFDFVNFDDPDYVTANPHVRNGITVDGLKWALTSGEAANWFPVTRLSHMLDAQLFGLNSGAHHGVNVAIHALAALLLFAFLHRATGALWCSAFVAAVFALHPLHVESVAWVSERKDVLSAFFWCLGLWGYARYGERPGTGRYLLVLGAFALGLMSKPMLVTFPFVLILIDLWPLRRGWEVREKIPFFALAAASALATFLVQRGSGAVQELGATPLWLRVENAAISYVLYIAKTLWPSGLAVFYPYPAEWPLWQVLLALVVLLGLSAAVWRSFPTRPYLAVGWLWFLGTLVPVIGLVQVGAQARADRYMYLPIVGLAIMAAWGAADAMRRWPAISVAVKAAAIAAGLAMPVAAWAQAQHWRNSQTLFAHALEVTRGNYLAHHNLGVALTGEAGRLPEAITHLETAVRLQPNSARARTDLGTALVKAGRLADAEAEYRAALRIEPNSPIPHNNLGSLLAKSPGRMPEAVAELETALRLNPGDPGTRNNLGYALLKSGRVKEAVEQFQAVLRADPGNAEAHSNLASALAESPGHGGDAMAEYEAAVRSRPGSAEAHNELGAALMKSGRLPDAVAQFEAALRLEPDLAEAHNNLGTALSAFPDRAREALSHFQAAARLAPGNAEVRYNLGAALARVEGRLPEAIAHLEAAVRLKPDYAEAHNNLGVALSGVPGRMDEAIAHFRTAVKLRPDYEDARENLKMATASRR